MRTPYRITMRRDVTCSAGQLVLAHLVKVRFLGLHQEPLNGQFALGVLGAQRLKLLHKLLGDTAIGIGKLCHRSVPKNKHARGVARTELTALFSGELTFSSARVASDSLEGLRECISNGF